MSEKIQWYSNCAKLPKEGDLVVFYSSYELPDTGEIFWSIDVDIYNETSSVNFTGIDNYWTHASNLNFPKIEG